MSQYYNDYPIALSMVHNTIWYKASLLIACAPSGTPSIYILIIVQMRFLFLQKHHIGCILQWLLNLGKKTQCKQKQILASLIIFSCCIFALFWKPFQRIIAVSNSCKGVMIRHFHYLLSIVPFISIQVLGKKLLSFKL